MKHAPGMMTGLAAIALFAVLAIGWQLLIGHLATQRSAAAARDAAAPPAGAVASGGVVIAPQQMILPDPVAALPEGPAGALLGEKCLACHSAEMILTQPALPAAKWQATVEKMRKVYAAPIDPADDARLVAALVALQSNHSPAS